MTAIVGDAGAPARGIFGQPKGLYYLARLPLGSRQNCE
jgi:hypothetical protein